MAVALALMHTHSVWLLLSRKAGTAAFQGEGKPSPFGYPKTRSKVTRDQARIYIGVTLQIAGYLACNITNYGFMKKLAHYK